MTVRSRDALRCAAPVKSGPTMVRQTMDADASGPQRAYVAAPIGPDEGLVTALKWCFQRDPTLRWEMMGFLVPHPEFVSDCPMLRRLRARGAPMATISARTGLEDFTGPLVVYRGNPRMLEIAEDLARTQAVVAVAERNDWLRPWVHSHQADHLAGDVL